MPEAGKTADDVAMHVFLRALEAAGGSRHLVQNDLLEWLPDLMLASYIVTLQDEEHETPEEIADTLNLSLGVVESVLRAPTEAASARLQEPPPLESDARYDVVGGIAKFAFGAAKREEGARSKPVP